MDSKSKWILALSIAVAVLSFIVFALFSREPNVVVKETHTTDTLVVSKIDTCFIKEPYLVEKEVLRVDTLYLEGSTFPLNYERTRYFEDGLYDVWVEGYDAKISSISVFPKTEYKYITNTIEREVVLQKWNFYVGAELGYFRRCFVPSVSLYATSKKKFLFGFKLGYFTDNQTALNRNIADNLYFGGTIAYKLNK